MSQCLVVGKANAGKTLFAVNFAAYLGCKEFVVGFQTTDGQVRNRYTCASAVRELTSSEPHTTRCLTTFPVEMVVGKGVQRFDIVDTVGLSNTILSDGALRSAMARTLAAMAEGKVFFHLIDASCAASSESGERISEIDHQLARYAALRGTHALLANKMDLPAATGGLAEIRRQFPGCRIFPVSALYQQGFKEVRRFARNAL